MKPSLILGREPALWLTLGAIIVKTVAAFGVGVSPDQQSVINAAAAALVGLIVAATTGDGVVAAVLGLAQAVIALAVGFGLNWSSDQQAIVMSLIGAAVAMFVRTQVTAPVSASQLRTSTAPSTGA